MANPEHLKILKQGLQIWNNWRLENLNLRPDLSNSDLEEMDLSHLNLTATNFTGAHLRKARLSNAVLKDSIMSHANLDEAIIVGTDLTRADLTDSGLDNAFLSAVRLEYSTLRRAKLRTAQLSWTIAIRANFQQADLLLATFNHVDLRNADLSGANFGGTVLADIDLSLIMGLEATIHEMPSTIGLDTLYISQGKIPEVFLHGCGVPDDMIEFSRSLIGRPLEFNSCFISYSTRDEEFSRRLHNDLQANGVRCWFAPHDMKGGKKLHEQIDQAIRMHDRLLLVLSPDSINSNWVKTEIAKARKREIEEKRQVLFPIRLVDFKTLLKWEYLDADTGTDYAKEIREYFIPDFSNWKDHDSYQAAFKKLLEDLKGESTKAAPPK